ncbi:MAG: cytochrome-c peroxidase, partial [Saprospiraceae bacterium]|nr:cytochrome-c peroxidase [Saprospiraceae bacterium]
MSKQLFSGLMALLLMAAVKPVFWGTPVILITPDYFPAIGYDVSRNPLTKEGIELGRRLFYDPVLSRDSTISCASCHLSYTAFTHVDHALSHGIGDRIGRRNSPTLQNLAWAKSYMWDGAIQHLDFQALAPISDTSEMGETLPNVIQKLQRNALWPSRFQAAFGDTAITGERLLKAIAQFELTLISASSRYDSVMTGKAVFTVQEQNGYQI